MTTKKTISPTKSPIHQNLLAKLEPTKKEVQMGSPSKSSRLRCLNQVQLTSNTFVEVKGKLKPSKEVIPMGTPYRSTRLRQSA